MLPLSTPELTAVSLPAYFDLQVHNQPSHEALVALDETQLYKDLYKKFKFVQPPEWGHAHAAEGVIMSGYDAGFYSYIW